MRQLNKAYPKAFRDEAIAGVDAKALRPYRDDRGCLLELFRSDESDVATTMAYLSETLPGVTRGPHEHADQTDVFVFVRGQGFLYLWDNRPESPTYGARAKYAFCWDETALRVVVPPGVVHAYRNAGHKPMIVFNGPDRLFAGFGKRDPVDEVRHEKDPDTPFVVW